MRKLKMLLVGAALFAVSSANAGALLSASYYQTLQGVPLVVGTLSGGTPTGTLVGNQFTLDAGNAFAIAFCIGQPGNVQGCIANPAGPFAPPVTRLSVTFGANGKLVGTTADPTITAPSGIMGNVTVWAKIGKAIFPLLSIPVNAGAGGNFTAPTVTSLGSPASLLLTAFGDKWHIGAVTQTGLTSRFATLPDVMATGSVMVTSMGNTNVNLVSLGRLKIRGLANSETASPTFLRMVFAPDVPEPGTLMLLGAGVAGLALIGRRKLQ